MTPEVFYVWISVAVVGGLCIALLIYAYTLGSEMRSYIKRGEQRDLWKQSFSELPGLSELNEVEKILGMFCTAYMFPSKALWCLRPDDLIADIHEKCTRRVNDGVQMEILLVQLSDQYNWKPPGDIMTMHLGELVTAVATCAPRDCGRSARET